MGNAECKLTVNENSGMMFINEIDRKNFAALNFYQPPRRDISIRFLFKSFLAGYCV